MWVYHFVDSSVVGHLSCFQLLAIKNKTAINIHIQVVVWAFVFISLE